MRRHMVLVAVACVALVACKSTGEFRQESDVKQYGPFEPETGREAKVIDTRERDILPQMQTALLQLSEVATGRLVAFGQDVDPFSETGIALTQTAEIPNYNDWLVRLRDLYRKVNEVAGSEHSHEQTWRAMQPFFKEQLRAFLNSQQQMNLVQDDLDSTQEALDLDFDSFISQLTQVAEEANKLAQEAERLKTALTCVRINGTKSPYNYGFRRPDGSLLYAINRLDQAAKLQDCQTDIQWIGKVGGVVCVSYSDRGALIHRISDGAQIANHRFSIAQTRAACRKAAQAATKKYVCEGNGISFDKNSNEATRNTFIYYIDRPKKFIGEPNYGEDLDRCIAATRRLL